MSSVVCNDNITKHDIKNFLKSATKSELDALMLTESDIECLEGDSVGILYKDGILVVSKPTVIIDKVIGSLINKGTYEEIRYAYRDMYAKYTNLAEEGIGDANIFLRLRDNLLLVELPCNRAIVEKVWSDNTYIGKLIELLIDKRGN